MIGESGSGKTTLFKVLLGINSPKNGFRIEGGLFYDKNILFPGKEKKIQPVFQDPSLYFNPEWKMIDSLYEPFYFRGISKTEAKNQIKNYLDTFSLTNINLENTSKTFSGGELQRLSILRAIFFEPEFLLMDEPVSGLDRLVLLDTIAFIKKLVSIRKITILIVSHDLEFISSISSFVYVLQNGKIVDSGTKEKVFNSPGFGYTSELLKARDLSNLRED